jgi:SNF2 family DNA or RNA helicase
MRWWKKTITDPQAAGDPRGLGVLRGILKEIMLRRTKVLITHHPLTHSLRQTIYYVQDSKDSTGKAIVQLPEKVIEIVYVKLSLPELEFYSALHRRSKSLVYGNSTLRGYIPSLKYS